MKIIVVVLLLNSVWESTCSIFCKGGALCYKFRPSACQVIRGMITRTRYAQSHVDALRKSVVAALEVGVHTHTSRIWWDQLCGSLIMSTTATQQIGSLYEVLFLVATNLNVAIGDEVDFAGIIGLTGFCAEHRESIERLLWEAHMRTWSNRPVEGGARTSLVELQSRYGYAANLPIYCPSLFASSERVRMISLAQRLFMGTVSHGARGAFTTVQFTPGRSLDSLEQLNTPSATKRVRVVEGPSIPDPTQQPIRLDEWFVGLALEMFTPDAQIFRPLRTSIFDQSRAAELLVGSGNVNEPKLRALGRFLAAAVIEQIPVPIYLSVSAYAFLTGLPLTLEDAEEADIPAVQPAALVPGSLQLQETPPVMTTEQFEATAEWTIVKAGFNSIIPERDMAGRVRAADFQSLVSGARSINIDDFSAHVQLDGITRDGDDQFEWLLTELRQSDENARKFLRFVTGSSQLPIGGFSALSHPITITRWAYDADTARPMADRSTSTLTLPVYTSPEVQGLRFASIFSDLATAPNRRFSRPDPKLTSPVCLRIPLGPVLPLEWVTEMTATVVQVVLDVQLEGKSPRPQTDVLWQRNCGRALIEAANERLHTTPDILLPLFTLAAIPTGLYGRRGIGARARKLDKFCEANPQRIREWLTAYSLKHPAAHRLATWHLPDVESRKREAILSGFGGELPEWCESLFTQGPLSLRIWALRQRIYALFLTGSEKNGLVLRAVPRMSALAHSIPFLMADSDSLRGGVAWIEFDGEEARGPGVARDWFSEMTRGFMNHQPPLVQLSSEAPHYLQLAPVLPDGGMRLLEALGRFMALAVIQNVPVAINFPVMLFARLIDKKISSDDIKQDEPGLFTTLTYALNCPEDELEYLGAIELNGVYVDLTADNRVEVIERKVNSLIGQEFDQRIDVMKRGFLDALGPAMVDFPLSAVDIKDTVIGTPVIDIDDLMRNVQLHGYKIDSPQIVWLRALLESYDAGMRKKFLRFVTGLETLPAGGFGSLPTPVAIHKRRGIDTLPTSSTCFNLYRLPKYRTEQALRELVTRGLNWGDGAFGNY